MNQSLLKGLIAHERLPSAHAYVGFCYFYSRTANLYFHILLKIKDRPSNFGRLQTIFY